jgi:hypothetical protein
MSNVKNLARLAFPGRMGAMDTSDDSDIKETILNYKTFVEHYFAAHPDGNSDFGDELHNRLVEIVLSCNSLADEYEYGISKGLEGSTLGLSKIYWLFNDLRSMRYSTELRSFVIERNEFSLKAVDYALLFYVSLQNEEIQDAARGIPLSMVHDMFMPIAENNLEKWKASLKNKS